MDIIADPDQPETIIVPRNQAEVATYLTLLLKDHGEEPEAMKAGIRFAVMALRRLHKNSMIPR